MGYYGMGDWNANPSTPGGNSNPVDTPKVEIIEPDETADGLTAREIVSRNIDSTVLLKTYRTTVAGGFCQRYHYDGRRLYHHQLALRYRRGYG